MSTELPPRRGSVPPPQRSATFDEAPLLSLASGTRRCVRMAGLGRLIVWLALAVCAVLALDLASGLPPRLRMTADVVILLGAAVLVFRFFWQRPREITTEKVTREVESEHPEFGQMLSTARDSSLSHSSVSPVLKNELFRRASTTLAGLDLKRSLPKRPVRQWLFAGVVALAGFCYFLSSNREAPVALARLVSPFSGITFTRVANTTPDPTFDRNRLPRVEATISGRPAQTVTVHLTKPEGGEISYPMNPLGGGRYEVTLPASESSFAFRIQAGDSQPVNGMMECVDPAEFVSSTAEIALPDYTGQPVVTQENADIEAVEGTRATVKFKMSAPMKNAQLKLPDGKLLNLEVKGDELSKSFIVGTGGDVAELTGTDARGHDIEPVQFKHKGVVDALPVVEWIEPTKDIEATAIAELPLRLRLRDDFGVASYGVVLQAQGESKEIMTKKLEAKDLRDLSEMTAAALETFPLTIRDNVRFFAWATDHKPRENARGVSKLRGVDIKPFKRKWQMLTGAQMEGIPIPEEDLMDVEKLIKGQREILSDAFAVIQGPSPAIEVMKGFGEREGKLQQEALKLHSEVLVEGNWPADDVKLLHAASSQMGESSSAWQTARNQLGFDRGDAALSTLLELRKNLLTILMKADCPCLEPKPEEVPVSLTDLAAEAERIAKEEHDVANQLVANPDADRLEAIRRQQHVANSDTGELYARLMDHPENTPLVLSQMDEAEKAVRSATRTTTSEKAVAEAPPLASEAAEKLERVAKTLRALDETKIDDTLAEMAKDARKAAEAAKPKDDQPKEEEKKEAGEQASKESGEKPGDKPSDKAGDKPGDKPGEKPGAGEGDKPAQAAGKKPGEGKGEGEGKAPSDKPGKGEGKTPGQGQGQGEGESEMAGKGKGAGQGQGAGQGEKPSDQPGGSDGKAPGKGEGEGEGELAANDPNAGNSLNPGEKSGEAKGEGPAASSGQPGEKDAEEQRKDELAKAARQSGMNDEILKFLAERESKDGEASRLEKLREENATDKFEDKLNDVAGKKADGDKTAEELKAFADALEQEREIRRQSRLESLAENRERAAELKKQAEATRDAEKKAAREREEMASNRGFSFEMPATLEEYEAQNSGKGKGEKPGKGQGEGPGNGPGGPVFEKAAQELARKIDALKDAELSRIARELEKSAPDLSSIRPLAEAERRLAALIEELSGVARGDESGGVVPPAYRRAVEDYYRALSDDFGDEEVAPR